MREIENNKSLDENLKLLGDKINSHLESLINNQYKNHQKILEICHVGKFLLFFNNEIHIDKTTEIPDFILSHNSQKIGLEHQIVIDEIAKEKEGFFENIFLRAESDLQNDPEIPNFLANCYLHPNIEFKLENKNQLIETVKKIVKEYVVNNNFIENELIESISKYPHTLKNIEVNLGAYWVKQIDIESIEKAIRKKESKISNYKKNSGNIQWLLLVIGSTGNSSFDMDKSLKFEIETEFDKVYILEDFKNKLYELK
ncbi:hypothetical protein KIH23_10165 [Flavobacterium sp. CYK-55]|uniref:hypothetical protein n=1 Tax=Flavobacterium sp. CYK-55 TaxID=2835529 RepID=UPI001BD16B0D|nr:hypothetical protein [Flavobacterium sp. CYK-55]MBS7787662.1 hypothetical protein [Flavobacterium sp. CYK-55]